LAGLDHFPTIAAIQNPSFGSFGDDGDEGKKGEGEMHKPACVQ